MAFLVSSHFPTNFPTKGLSVGARAVYGNCGVFWFYQKRLRIQELDGFPGYTG